MTSKYLISKDEYTKVLINYLKYTNRNEFIAKRFDIIQREEIWCVWHPSHQKQNIF